MSEILLRVRDLKTYFFTSLGLAKAVDGVSFKIHKGEVLGLIGESGSGKSVTALSIMNLIPSPPGKIVDGQVLLDDFDLLQTKESEMWKIRGKRIAMSFQDPMTYLNPVHRIGDQIAEAIIIHQKLRKSEAFEKAIEIMELVQIPDAPQKARDYPHMLSGGMRQRVLLAMALSCNPELIIADEPTTALDVIVQANILDLLKELKLKLNLSMLLISHDLGVVARLADRVAIMYAGRIMEYGEITTIFDSPKNPYTIGLLDSLPRIEEDQEKLISIPGDIPDMINPPSGCRFNPRCSHAISRCREEVPSLIEYEKDHLVACFQINKF
ncbi:peptide ABC transporter ATP-binding protein [Candidatus Bathyarchaeota archaeon]|nr:peptide ABC transporter ATP-binding protein [Candidatus Bathyarchaeota archaeon]